MDYTDIALAYVTQDGTGYLQSKFTATCPACAFSLNKEKLGLLKFTRNAVLDPRNKTDKQHHGHSVYLACV